MRDSNLCPLCRRVRPDLKKDTGSGLILCSDCRGGDGGEPGDPLSWQMHGGNTPLDVRLADGFRMLSWGG